MTESLKGKYERTLEHLAKLKQLRQSKKPTSIEKHFMEICEKHNLPFDYVGNFQYWIGTRNPDFIHLNGENYEEECKKYYSQHGWKCYVFRGNRRLNESEILEQLKDWRSEAYGY